MYNKERTQQHERKNNKEMCIIRALYICTN